MQIRRYAAAGLVAALAVAFTVALGAAPANADPLAGGAVTIDSATVTLGSDATGRTANVNIVWTNSDAANPGAVQYSISDYSSCDTPTVRTSSLASTNGDATTTFDAIVHIDPDGYVRLDVESADGAGGSTAFAPVYADSGIPSFGDVGASFTPDDPAVGSSGIFQLNSGGEVPFIHYQLLANGVATGPAAELDGCSETVVPYSGYAPGTVLSLRFIEADVEAAHYVVPGAVTPPAPSADPTDPGASTPTLATTGADATVPTIVASVLLLAGLALLTFAMVRRRRHRFSHQLTNARK
jgi:hypothetical protein